MGFRKHLMASYRPQRYSPSMNTPAIRSAFPSFRRFLALAAKLAFAASALLASTCANSRETDAAAAQHARISVEAAAPAGPQYAIAMHGLPALPPNFTHLPYANPDAPKGGRLVIVGTRCSVLHAVSP